MVINWRQRNPLVTCNIPASSRISVPGGRRLFIKSRFLRICQFGKYHFLLIFFNVLTTFYIKISWKENSTVFYQRNNAANRIKISFNLLINNQITILSVFNFQRFWIQVDDLVITKAGSWLFLCMYYFILYLIFNCTDNRYIFELYFTNLMHSFN